MEPTRQISDEKYRRMFPPESGHRLLEEEADLFGRKVVELLHLHSYHRSKTAWPEDFSSVDAARGSGPDYQIQAESLSASAAMYTLGWRKTLEEAIGLLGAAPASQSRPISATIKGRAVEFGSAEEKFDALATEWKRLRGPGSSTAELVNDAYGQIVAMGWDAVPFLLREVQRQSGHWFTALTWITAHDPATPEMRGNIRALRAAWVQWGTENGYLSGNSERKVVSR